MRLIADPVVHDLQGGADDHKGIIVDPLHQPFKRADLPYGDNSVQYIFLTAAVAAFPFDNGNAAVDILQYFLGYFPPFLGNDDYSLTLAEAGDNNGGYLGTDIDDNKSIEYSFQGIGKGNKNQDETENGSVFMPDLQRSMTNPGNRLSKPFLAARGKGFAWKRPVWGIRWIIFAFLWTISRRSFTMFSSESSSGASFTTSTDPCML